ncbi:MAG: tRNA-binding protein [Candidatus Zixiibacteriota bacterium]|nr:MAG: tRNA-binding protein [candidate division Zixibacteria bacterium]
MSDIIAFEDFEKVDIRVGRIVEVEDFERARFPSYKFKIDFGPEIGTKQSSGRYKENYSPEELLGRQCLAVVNFEPKNIAGYMSEVLVLGVDRQGGGISLISPAHEAVLGARLY